MFIILVLSIFVHMAFYQNRGLVLLCKVNHNSTLSATVGNIHLPTTIFRRIIHSVGWSIKTIIVMISSHSKHTIAYTGALINAHLCTIDR